MKPDYTVLFNPSVAQDINKNTEYFLNIVKNEKIKEKFLKSIEKTISNIKSNPFHYQIRYSNIRLIKVKPFQHLLHFWIDQEKLQLKIEGIFHPSQNPRDWEKRINH
ncbi:hypothetical protein Belba_3506 [Belliella baltica DSM 15883]|uniref:Plasmid stabilization system protein n=1 Tax=Belliella baltica (strain DSM 15883 / CIP 108006 / LMG 21964 / BA134) TaxID=866536 RepID=I3Z9T9_BELBD|nr:type II toxin-antitoxin system RelE/ParE family toxin [Belliella baltica]AFL86007.1 hypothetical protein Belba_3506 [Belliella baltica DSM 15883]